MINIEETLARQSVLPKFTELLDAYENGELEIHVDTEREQRVEAMRERGPKRGDIWIAARPADPDWDSMGNLSSEYLLILAVDDRTVTAVPLSNDLRTAVPGTLVTDNGLYGPVVAFPDAKGEVFRSYLINPISILRDDWTDAIEHDETTEGVQRGHLTVEPYGTPEQTIDALRNHMAQWRLRAAIDVE